MEKVQYSAIDVAKEKVEKEFSIQNLLDLYANCMEIKKIAEEKSFIDYDQVISIIIKVYFKILKEKLQLADDIIKRILDISCSQEGLEDIGLLDDNIIIKVLSDKYGSRVCIVNDNSYTFINDDSNVSYLSKALENGTQK